MRPQDASDLARLAEIEAVERLVDEQQPLRRQQRDGEQRALALAFRKRAHPAVQQRSQIEATNLKRKQEAEKIAKKVDGTKIVVIRQASETGLLFGSVANRDIADGVTAAGYTIDRRQVILDKPIKTLGLHKVRVALHPEVIVTVTANVAKSEDEAAQQEKLGTAVTKATEGEAPDLDKLLEEAAQAQAEAGTGEQPEVEA